MIPGWLRLVAALPLLGLGVALLARGSAAAGASLLALGVLLVAAWVRYGDVIRASRAHGEGDRELAWKRLRHTPAGGRLLALPCRVAYHQIRATWYLDQERWDEAARECDAAFLLRLTQEQQASLHTSAALARLQMGEGAAAKRHYDAAKVLPKTEAMARRLARLAPALDPKPPEAG